MIQNPIIAGKKLPELTNPAGASNIESGYEAIDENGNKITGTKLDSKITNFSISSFSKTFKTDDVVVASANLANFVGRFFIAYKLDGSTLTKEIGFLKDEETLVLNGDAEFLVLDGDLKINMDWGNMADYTDVKIFMIKPTIS